MALTKVGGDVIQNPLNVGIITATRIDGNVSGDVNSTGVSTFTTLKVGTGVTISGGIVTATSFSGSGANLTGIAATTDVRTNSLVVSGVSTLTTLNATSIVGVTTAGITTAYIGSVNDGPIAGTRNRIINGDMRIDQRNAGASVSTSATVTYTYTLDRWLYLVSAASKFNIQQNAGSVTPPPGFSNYLGCTSTSAYTVSSFDYFLIGQRLEGFNFSDFNYGTADAVTLTFSFWVRSSLTGTFGGFLRNSANNRFYAFSYTVSAANTWEQKRITVTGDTSGTWVGATNGIGLDFNFTLAAGSSYLGTPGSWGTSAFLAPTGATSVVGTNGATFYITGVQLEPGTVATPFERRSFGQELALCQRYYYKMYSNTISANVLGVGFNENTTLGVFQHYFPIPMRTNPTTLQTSGTASDYAVRHANTITTASSIPSFSDGTVYNASFTIAVSSGLIAGQSSMARAINTNATLAWSAEL